MAGINMVKFYFLRGAMPKDPAALQQLTTLAYQTARDNKLFPKEILIRGPGHSTTSIGGRYRPDPKGNHFTFCYKDEEQVQRGTHTACHGYTPSPIDYNLTSVDLTPEKPDAVRKRRNNKAVWPADGDPDLLTGPTIGYDHK